MNLLDEGRKPTILMVDNEPLMIDRRIILEGQTLANAGYKVVLATRGDGVKPAIEIERGVEIHRFIDPATVAIPPNLKPNEKRRLTKDHNQLLSIDLEEINGWISSPSNSDFERWIDQRLASVSERVRLVIYYLAWPPIMAAYLRSISDLKSIFGRAFEPIIYLLMMRPSFLLPYFRLLIAKIFKKEGAESFSNVWLSQLESYAVSLRPDVVHAHDLPNLELGIRIAEAVGARLIYDAHELYPMQHFTDEDRRKSLFDLEKSLIKKSDAVITVNRQCAEIIEATYGVADVVPLTNATVAPEGFDPRIRLRLWHEKFNLSEDVKIMVFQGGINPVRNIDQLVYALAEIPDCIHVGFITFAKDIKYYEDLSRRLGLFHRIHYVVEIPWGEVIDWLASADVGIMPYQATNFNAEISSPNKLYEFVVAGIPVIGSSELVNVKQAIEMDGLGLTVFLREPHTYVEVIRAMFENIEGPERFRENVLKARHRYMWSNEEAALLALYRRIMSPDFIPNSSLIHQVV